MFDWLRRSGRDMSDCGSGTPLQCIEKCGALDRRLMAAHVNYLGRHDVPLLGRRQAHVVHCPRSHAYFRHDAFPLCRLLRGKVNVCLGTDSLVSVEKTLRQSVELSLFDEMRHLAAREPSLSPRTILQMATVNGARALGMAGEVGELTQGAFADLIALPLAGKGSNGYEVVLAHQGHVSASMIDGQWAIAPAVIQGELPNLWRHE
jgi:aminodeoxyfutalosine deaminase